MRQIKITVASVAAIADLEDNSTADAIWETLPLTGRANTWGDEIYFEIPVFLETAAGAREVVAVGELGYWPAGHAFCIFFGRTPASRGSEPRAASAVNVFGRIAGDATILRQVESGETVFVERIE